jgi:hypothetical protein
MDFAPIDTTCPCRMNICSIMGHNASCFFAQEICALHHMAFQEGSLQHCTLNKGSYFFTGNMYIVPHVLLSRTPATLHMKTYLVFIYASKN